MTATADFERALADVVLAHQDLLAKEFDATRSSAVRGGSLDAVITPETFRIVEFGAPLSNIVDSVSFQSVESWV